MKVADFDYCLPKSLIAKRPLKNRANSRLLVLHRDGFMEHKKFSDIPLYLQKGDMLLLNNTKVFPAKLTGVKENGRKIDFLLIRKKEDNTWDVLSRKSYTGLVRVSEDLNVELSNGNTARLYHTGNLINSIWKYGNMPLPPYIKRLPDEMDKKTYQTIFAQIVGSIAAPTAGLHFTKRLLNKIALKGVLIRELTLHIGIGTFRPIKTTHIENHLMEPEFFEIEKRLINEIQEYKASGKKIIAVGTTTTRAIEGYLSGMCTVSIRNGKIQGMTNAFIYPGFTFKAINALITNFHLPRSTPLMLASSLCKWKQLNKAYEEAIARRYRFLSYGDAMLIL